MDMGAIAFMYSVESVVDRSYPVTRRILRPYICLALVVAAIAAATALG